MSFEDTATSVRSGEELDAEKLDQFLKTKIPGLKGELSITQFPGGASNLTYLLNYPDRELVLRRPPFGKKAKSAHDMGREFKVMRGLQNLYPYVPEMVAFCEDESVLGAEFYVMERLRGIILRKDIPSDMTLAPEQARALCEAMVERLVELHNVPWQGSALSQLAKEGDYVERQISGWSDRYRRARTDDAPDYEVIMAWLEEHRPRQIRQCLVHNDYRFDNLVLDPDDPMRITGVLDWEMATIGDPLMDLGNSLAYWIEKDDPQQLHMLRRQPSHLPGMLTRQELVDLYLQKSGIRLESFKFYEIYGIFRLVVIIQQIYYRYFHKQTQDPRFAPFIHMVNYLEGYLQRKIEAA